MKHAIITKNVTDFRAKPNFSSERKSQLLYNEVIKIGPLKNGYYEAKMIDGYGGFVSQNAVSIISSENAKELLKKQNYIIKSLSAKPIKNNGGPYLLHYGTKVCVKSIRNDIGKYTDANGVDISLNRSHLAKISDLIKTKNLRNRLLKEAEKFLGVQYLWGGKTPFGIDCSGLAQLVYSRFGINLPRDSKDQSKGGKEISIDDTQRGDLFYFPGHVAIAYNKRRFIHASLKEGGVEVNNFIPGHPAYREDLHKSISGVRRVLP